MSSLEGLPEDCLSLILSRTSPIDVCRLASVSRFFSVAARSNVTWLSLLPSDYADALRCYEARSYEKPYPLPDLRNRREVFRWLSNAIILVSSYEGYFILKHTGGVCRVLSASAMNIAWGDDCRFWRWNSSRSSIFPSVAHLLADCWLEVTGKWSCTLPPGKYSVSWRLKVVNPQGGQRHFLMWLRPLRFFLSHSGITLEKELDFLYLPSNAYEKWFEFEVGQIHVKGPGRNVVHVDLDFGFRELDCSFWKGGLYLDCLTNRIWYAGALVCFEQQ
ncbi:hypothetical protein KP509_04G094000 [Ceratopteris richardii]|uniref:F-box domain-containing protein n=1 Tax=Ceratopteris richardii TaxID=49495 RepID=A0A8T2UZL3_CERRI|nr:hypothetical protein KP509_04G094000 [Ceratopteris richardii]